MIKPHGFGVDGAMESKRVTIHEERQPQVWFLAFILGTRVWRLFSVVSVMYLRDSSEFPLQVFE